MIGRADIEGSKSNVAMNAWLPQASYPYGTWLECLFIYILLPSALFLCERINWSASSGPRLGASSCSTLLRGTDYILCWRDGTLSSPSPLSLWTPPMGMNTVRGSLRIIQSQTFLPYPRSLPRPLTKFPCQLGSLSSKELPAIRWCRRTTRSSRYDLGRLARHS